MQLQAELARVQSERDEAIETRDGHAAAVAGVLGELAVGVPAQHRGRPDDEPLEHGDVQAELPMTPVGGR